METWISSSTSSSQAFNRGRVVGPEQRVQATVAGSQIEDNHEPGGSISVRIRGATSVTASSEPLYVIELNAPDNAIVVGTASELGRRECTAQAMHYISGETPNAPFRATAKIRYKAREAAVTVWPEGALARVEFDEPQRDVTPGQGLVLFDGEVVVGQGIIV